MSANPIPKKTIKEDMELVARLERRGFFLLKQYSNRDPHSLIDEQIAQQALYNLRKAGLIC
jgi:hypothetical protein